MGHDGAARHAPVSHHAKVVVELVRLAALECNLARLSELLLVDVGVRLERDLLLLVELDLDDCVDVRRIAHLFGVTVSKMSASDEQDVSQAMSKMSAR